MRRIAASILALTIMGAVVGCGSIQFSIKEPQAAQLTYKSDYLFWESWKGESVGLPAALTLNAHDKAIYKISDIPLHEGLTVYATVDTKKATDFTRVASVPIVINAQDLKDVEQGNVVRIVLVDPKKEYQTSQFESLRLSPTDDAYKRAKEIGTPIAVVTLGNREPSYRDFFGSKRAASY